MMMTENTKQITLPPMTPERLVLIRKIMILVCRITKNLFSDDPSEEMCSALLRQFFFDNKDYRCGNLSHQMSLVIEFIAVFEDYDFFLCDGDFSMKIAEHIDEKYFDVTFSFPIPRHFPAGAFAGRYDVGDVSVAVYFFKDRRENTCTLIWFGEIWLYLIEK